MPRAVGLDIGRTSIKVAAVETSAKRTRLLAYASATLDRGLDAEDYRRQAARAIDRIFRENRLDRTTVIASFDADACVLRDITVPFKSREQIDKIIRFEAEHHLVGTSVDDVVVDYLKVGEIGEKSRLLLVAARKEKLRERLGVAVDGGVDPLELELDTIAIFNAVAHTPLAAQHENFLIVEIQPAQIQIMVIEERGLSHIRVSRLGSESGGGEVLAEGEDPAPAESARHRQGYLDRLTRVLRQFMIGTRLRTPPELIVLTGAGSSNPQISEHLAREFEMEVKPLDLGSYVDLEASIAHLEMPTLDAGTAAVGLALKGCGVDRSGMKFRKDDLAFQRRFEQLRLYLLSCALLLLVGAFVPAVYYQKLALERRRQYEVEFTLGDVGAGVPSKERTTGLMPELAALLMLPNLRDATGLTSEEIEADFNRVSRAAPDERIDETARLLSRYNALVDESLGVGEDILPIESSFLILAQVFNVLKDVSEKSQTIRQQPLRIYDIDITTRQMTIEIWAPTVADHDTIRDELFARTQDYFATDPNKGWRPQGTERVEDDGIRRTLNADRLPEEERKRPGSEDE